MTTRHAHVESNTFPPNKGPLELPAGQAACEHLFFLGFYLFTWDRPKQAAHSFHFPLKDSTTFGMDVFPWNGSIFPSLYPALWPLHWAGEQRWPSPGWAKHLPPNARSGLGVLEHPVLSFHSSRTQTPQFSAASFSEVPGNEVPGLPRFFMQGSSFRIYPERPSVWPALKDS